MLTEKRLINVYQRRHNLSRRDIAQKIGVSTSQLSAFLNESPVSDIVMGRIINFVESEIKPKKK